MKKCAYAFDKNDDYCKTCNGITMIVNGEEYSCTECQAYTEGDEVETKPTEEVNTDAPMNPPEEVVEEAQTEPEATETTQTENVTVEEEKQSTKSPIESDDVSVVDEVSESTEEEQFVDGVKVTAMRYMSGITLNKSDVYYKFTAEEEWSVNQDIVNTPEAMQNVRERLWAKINCEVDSQVEDVLKNV